MKTPIRLAALSFLALSACNLSPEAKDAIDRAFAAQAGGSNPVLPPVAPSCFDERFTQPRATVVKKLDLLFVVDTSGSMSDNRRRVAEGVDAFVGALPSDVKFRIGVMLAHGSRSSYAGLLFKNSGSNYVLDSETMSLATIKSQLQTNIVTTPTDNYSDGGEEGLYSFLHSLDAAKLSRSQGQGFFRPDAALAVVFMSDENDICTPNYAPHRVKIDTENMELPAYTRDCTGVTPESVLAALKRFKGQLPVFVGAVVNNDDARVPASGEDSWGAGYLELAALAEGGVVNINDGDYRPGLSQIGSMVSYQLQLLSHFTLAHSNVEPTSVRVYVDGVETHDFNLTVDAGSGAVQVNLTGDLGRAESVIDVTYCEKTPDVDPSPSVSVSPDPSPSVSVSPSPSPSVSVSPSPSPSVSPTCDPTDPLCNGTGGS